MVLSPSLMQLPSATACEWRSLSRLRSPPWPLVKVAADGQTGGMQKGTDGWMRECRDCGEFAPRGGSLTYDVGQAKIGIPPTTDV